MKIPLPCHECGADSHMWVFAEIDGGDVLAGVCPQGHEVRFRLSYEAPHELLLDAGALALLDEYYREAVANFAAGLEQSFEFYVEASMYAAGIPDPQIRKLLTQNRLDQRRLGMMSACYLRDTGQPFDLLDNRYVAFRNRVVHNAAWPARAEAVGYADYVCRTVIALHAALGSKLSALLDLKDERADAVAADDLRAGRTPPSSLMARASFLVAFQRNTGVDTALADFQFNGWWAQARTQLHQAATRNAG